MREIITVFVILLVLVTGLSLGGAEVVFDSPISPLPTPTLFKTAHVPGGPPIDTPTNTPRAIEPPPNLTNTPTISPLPTLSTDTPTSTPAGKDSADGGQPFASGDLFTPTPAQAVTLVPVAIQQVVVEIGPEFLGNCFFLRADLVCYQ